MTKMYFNNEEIEKQIIIYLKTKDPQIIEELAPVFNKLITGVIGRYKLLRRNYINNDISQEAWLGIMEVINKWEKNKGDAFSYFTAVIRNKIFWFLKNQYKDTSYNSEDPVQVDIEMQITDYNPNISEKRISSRDKIDPNYESCSITDYIKKLDIYKLKLGYDDQCREALEIIKGRLLSEDNIENEELIIEIQRETQIPKKKIRLVLTAIYSDFIGE